MEKKRVSRKQNPRVAIGISGGVDSAVAAALLKRGGYDVVGVHLYCYDEGPWCTAREDREMAVRVAKHLGIPLKVWDLRKEYKSKVIRYFFDEYEKGRTPNPDIVCNREIKFGIFLSKALKELDVDYVATGHYARLRREVPSNKSQVTGETYAGEKSKKADTNNQLTTTAYRLLTGADRAKDQSYFLYTLTQKQLEHILFPLGNYRKDKVRKLAKELGLPNYNRRDSAGICFIGPIPVAKFLREYLPTKIGTVVNTKGEVIGEHDGVWFFTEGQRHGFQIFKSTGLPFYVVGKHVSENILIVGRGEESKVGEFEIESPHWIGKLEDIPELRVGVRIRHLGEIMPATAKSLDFKPLVTSRRIFVALKQPTNGMAPGQSAVFYLPAGRQSRYEEVLGGGVIRSIPNPIKVRDEILLPNRVSI
ncbi:tRNA 2-thiouridine(34) synthase MnmA [Candidatus Saccharibacteria bacterium]|nr:tRNA 2-thiouridine(34) synthase MnmA [Candidatus Saccharibacteria bacterium]